MLPFPKTVGVSSAGLDSLGRLSIWAGRDCRAIAIEWIICKKYTCSRRISHCHVTDCLDCSESRKDVSFLNNGAWPTRENDPICKSCDCVLTTVDITGFDIPHVNDLYNHFEARKCNVNDHILVDLIYLPSVRSGSERKYKFCKGE